jgi:hypothetical protein
LKRLRALIRVQEEMSKRVKQGMDPHDAADEAMATVSQEFSAIDWMTLLPLILQLVTMLAELFKK